MMRMSLRIFSLIIAQKVFIVAFLFLVCSCIEATPEIPIIFPTDVWQESAPEDLQVDAQKLQEALEYLASESGEDGLEEVLIVRKGYLIYQGDSIYNKHNIYNSSKSFTSTALGLLSDLGIVRDYTRSRYIDAKMEERYPALQLKHFASMTSGYSGKGISRTKETSEDRSWTPYDMATPLFEPGTEFAYSDEAQMMFARLLTKRAKKTLKAVFDDHIGNAIGMGKFEWITAGEVDGIPINNGSTGVVVNAQQLARLGHLYLNEGHWNGKQLLSRYWIKKATSNQVDTDKIANTDRKDVDGRGCYGYNWWVNGLMPTGNYHMPDAPKSLYYSSGLQNNVCFVIPEWDMVFVRGGEDGIPKKGIPFVYNEFFKRMALAIVK